MKTHPSPGSRRLLTLLLVGGAILFSNARAAVAAIFTPLEPSAFPLVRLSQPARGEAAVQALGERIAEVARAYGQTPEKLRDTLRRDPTLGLDISGRLLYFDEALPGNIADQPQTTPAPEISFPLSQTFNLHSRPGSKRVIYLDFDGHTLTNTAWNAAYNQGAPILAPAFDVDGNPGWFNDTERTRIQQIWQRVSEDYAPFDVDVTTEPIDESLLTRSSTSDEFYGIRVLISPLSSLIGNYGGVAYVGAFNRVGDYYKPALVFPERLAKGEKYIAEACAHEAGHTLGLQHDGTTTGQAYYAGHGSGDTGWAPIMGNGYYKNLTQWSRGEYLSANNSQSDLTVIQSFGLAPAADDYGDTLDSAAYFPAGTTLDAGGSIGLNDMDVLAFSTGSGRVTLSIRPAARGPNLDLAVDLTDATGTLLASSNPPDRLDAAFDLDLTQGTYYLHVRGSGKGDPLAGGYTSYGSLGNYIVSGTVQDPVGTVPPVAVASAAPPLGDAPVQVQFSATDSFDQDGSIVAYAWDFGDGAGANGPVAAHTYHSVGYYTATLTVTDDDGLSSSTAVLVEACAPNQAPVANVTATPVTGPAPLDVTFLGGTSWDPDGSIATYDWSFGDGATATGPSVAYRYSNPGTYTAVLTVTDNKGASQSRSVQIEATAPVSTELRVASISLAVIESPIGKSVGATVMITTASGAAVGGVTVTGRWSGAFTGTSTGVTDASGTAFLKSSRSKRKGVLTFTITGLSKEGFTFDPTTARVISDSITIDFTR